MAQNGDINEKFGIYKSVCCDAEIVIAEGKKFPECPRHPNRTLLKLPRFFIGLHARQLGHWWRIAGISGPCPEFWVLVGQR
jgi:hypothetical protein